VLTEAAPRLYIHIGLQKTGTSFIQKVLWDSTDELLQQGVEMVPGSKIAMFRLMLDVRDRYNPDIDPASVSRSLKRLPDQLRRAQRTALISQESLATASAPQIERLLEATSGREVHVLVTLRDLGRQLPSAWQQTLQMGGSEPFPKYLRRLRDKEGVAGARIWAALDAPAILERWCRYVPAERITLVTVPPSGSDRLLLLRRYCEAVGITPDMLNIDESSRGNRSLRAEQAELLRRVNRQLPKDFKERHVYGDLGKRYFAVKILGDDDGTPIRLPIALYEWCAEVSQRNVENMRQAGYRVVGGLDELLPDPASFSVEQTRVSHRAVASVASRAIADMLVNRMQERATGSRQQGGQPPPTGLLRRLAPQRRRQR
jgi:hypothetical protein